MSGKNRAAVLGAWALTAVAAFAVGRSTAPADSSPVSEHAPENLAAALRVALGEPDVLDRTERTARLLQDLGPENVMEVVEVYDGMLNILGELAIRPFIAAWARFDPEAALTHTLRWGYRDKKEIGAGAAIEAWALRDPVGALEAFEQLSQRNPRLRDLMFSDLLTGWLYSGEGGLDDYLANLPTHELSDAVTRVAAKTLRNGGPDAMVRWVNSITSNDAYDIKFKKKAFQRGSRMIARLDPERAAAWVMENREENFAYDGPRIVAEQWGAQDGRAALDWVRNHPNENIHHQAAREAFLAWFESDRAGAAEWLKSEELTPFHDPAVVLYAKEIGKRAPEEAIGWCERVHDEKRQYGCFKRAASSWYERDAVAAETWLQQSTLDEAARLEVRTPRKKRWQLRPESPSRGEGNRVR